MLVDTRLKHPEIPLEDYCDTIMVVSDMQFNPTNRWDSRTYREQTTYEAMQSMLRTVFPDEWVNALKIVWWYCAGREEASKDVPATMDKPGMYLISGFDGSVLSLILNTKIDEKTGEKRQLTMEESVQEALSQEVLQLVQ